MNLGIASFFVSLLGTVASIASLFYSLSDTYSSNITIRFILILFLILTSSSAFFSFKYYRVSNKDYLRYKRTESFRELSAKLYESFCHSYSCTEGTYLSFIDNGLALIELYQDLAPETFDEVKKDIKEKQKELVNSNYKLRDYEDLCKRLLLFLSHFQKN